ncbi:Thiamine-monophosphate kinase protein [Halorhabdus tiamatea SARL4B]|uniref:Thiamine-monophosphate kinase n=1 Tax=Halorhabdus tiamatea SARL4B TaxID=1033806 RepID=F7PNF4_9EURY|nr:thiamine-phosphate kinase [Halorhabdus tiamatea]ERJ06247.1 Thiamine-monophosphate kinase protein [Halorhabdus tiamatea SARL4B]CCQ33807.1 thiamine-monophosphate kinase [Halorhabdus tiamatea SARL4B]
MDERSALGLIADRLEPAGDDAAIVDGLVVTIDMLHESTDFPVGTTRYTAGWRAVGASLSDVAAMGAEPTAAVAVYGAPTFDGAEITAFVDGARDVCAAVDGAYVGGDLDEHEEFTVATAAVGRTDDPVLRSGASPGDIVCVTGTLGRSAAALGLFETGEYERANDLFRFEPRVGAGRALAPYASAMMDSSDGLARSLHQLAEASDVGFAVESPLPIDEALEEVTAPEERQEVAVSFGEDFELVCTIPPENLDAAREASPTRLTSIGRVTADGEITLDGEPLADRGFTHGESA